MGTTLKNEDLDLKENTDVNEITNKGILIFTVHRSGSMLVHTLCSELCSRAGITYYSPHEREFFLPETEEIINSEYWEGKRGCFGPIRWFVNVPNMEDYNVIVHLRDPRDVLVSMFYSYCYSHDGEIEGNTGYRKKVSDAGIDNFVLNMTSGKPPIRRYGTGQPLLMGNVLERYENYVANLLGRPNVTFIKYEEMVTDFPGWLNKLLLPFDIQNKNNITRIFLEACKNEFDVSNEDIWKHKRRVTPGSHREKLEPETIAELNKRFSNVLVKLNYGL